MTATTFVATTAEGNTVIRTSATKDYNFVILAKNQKGGPARENDDVEGAWGWSGDKANADKMAVQATKAYKSVRVVPVEQKLTGKEASLVREAVKAGAVTGSGSQYVGGSARNGAAPMGKLDTTTTNTEEEIAVPTATATKAKAKKAVVKVVTKAEAEKLVAAHQADAKAAELAAAAEVEAIEAEKFQKLLSELAKAQAEVAALLRERNARIDTLITAGTISGPKLAKIMGVTPMAVYNMRAKATA